MKLYERGVLPESNIYFHIPKEHNRKVFLTPKSCGYFFCDSSYRVTRDKYSGYFLQNDTRFPGIQKEQLSEEFSEIFPQSDIYTDKEYHHGSYLCLFVKSGRGYVYQNDRKVVLNENDVFLLDCYHPHIYGTLAGSKMEMIWVHFDGTMIRGCFKQIANNTNCAILKNLSLIRTQTIYSCLYSIYEKFDQQKGVNDILNNKYFVNILTEFLQENSKMQESESNSWDDLLTYISENIQKPLKPKDLAERMALSTYHFIRKFKKEIGYTPYRYVLLAKMSAANHLLKYSSLSIKEIAHTCGFSSEGSFCNAFKNIFGVWPMSYRKK